MTFRTLRHGRARQQSSAGCRLSSAARARECRRCGSRTHPCEMWPGRSWGCPSHGSPTTSSARPVGQLVGARTRAEYDRPVGGRVEVRELPADVELAARRRPVGSADTDPRRKIDGPVSLERDRGLGRSTYTCVLTLTRSPSASLGTQPLELFGRIGRRTRYHVFVGPDRRRRERARGACRRES